MMRRNLWRAVYSVPSSPPPSPVNQPPFNESCMDFCVSNASSANDLLATSNNNNCPYFFHHLDFELKRMAQSIPMSLNKASSLTRGLFESGPHSRGESSLELEAVAAVHQLSFAVQSINVSEMLPRTPELIFVNVTTLEGQPYCLELTSKGWRITSLRSDCMQGDFTRMDLFTKYYGSVYDLMEVISPGYKERFGERLAQRLRLLEAGEEMEYPVPPSSYINSPINAQLLDESSSSISTTSTPPDTT